MAAGFSATCSRASTRRHSAISKRSLSTMARPTPIRWRCCNRSRSGSRSSGNKNKQTTGALGGLLPRYLSRFDHLFLNRLPYALLLRKSAWQSIGGYDAGMRDGYEDWEFNIRLVLAGWQGVRIARPLFIYYVSAEGM